MDSMRLDELFDRHLDGMLSAAEERELADLLSCPEGKDRWCRLTELEGRLHEEYYAARTSQGSPSRFRRNPVREAIRPRRLVIPAVAAAAILLAVLTLLFLIGRRTEPEIIAVNKSSGVPNRTERVVAPPESERGNADPQIRPAAQASRPSPSPQSIDRPGPPPTSSEPAKAPPTFELEIPQTVDEAPADPKPDAPSTPGTPGTQVATTVRLQSTRGQVFLVSLLHPDHEPGVEGQDLEADQTIVAQGEGSGASLVHPDGTRLNLGPDTELRYDGSPDRVYLSKGRVDADVAKRPKGNELVFLTPHARLRILGTRFTLSSVPEETRLQLQQGSIEFANLIDGKVLRVEPRQTIVARGPPRLDAAQVARRIKRGVDYLRQAESPELQDGFICNSDELVLLAFVHGGISPTDARYQELFRKMIGARLERTYKVAVQAMVLEAVDPVLYQRRIQQCAQFLADNQCQNGQWGYGEASPFAEDSLGAPRAKSGGPNRIQIKKMVGGPAAGDNSNSQVAALGIRACYSAGITFPKDLILRARKWWEGSQHPADDGKPRKRPGLVTGPGTPEEARGWCYQDNGDVCKGGPAYASMTAGGVAAVTILDSILSWDARKDSVALGGLAWIARNFSVQENLGPSEVGEGKPNAYLLYYLAALERMSMLLGIEKLGGRDWYQEGARVLLEKQEDDGSWRLSEPGGATSDTCFAILFLGRSTRRLPELAAVDRTQPTPRK